MFDKRQELKKSLYKSADACPDTILKYYIVTVKKVQKANFLPTHLISTESYTSI